MLLNSILDTVGKTPLIPLNRVGSKLKCNLYAKCEFFNPGGSVKDRIALNMIEKAEAENRIKPGDTLIEPTSGNTGIGLALAGAVKGYQVIITMPEKMSREKQVILESLGAKIIRTPTEAAWDDSNSHISVAKKLQAELPNAHILDQYSNPANPLAHYENTGQEILDDLNKKVDMVIIGAGTGGTLTGIARKMKENNPDCLIIGADPVGSILAGPAEVSSYEVEGIGYDFIPEVLDTNLVDTWVKTRDRQSFLLAKRLIREEGLLCGGSSGAALYAALQEAPRLKEGQNCVVILPDGIRNYLSKFVDDKWLKDHRFLSDPGIEGSIADFPRPSQAPVCLDISESVSLGIKIMQEHGFSQIPVTDKGILCGMLYEKNMLDSMISHTYDGRALSVGMIMSRNLSTVHENTPISALQELLASSDSVLVIDNESKPLQIITKIDLVAWLNRRNSKSSNHE